MKNIFSLEGKTVLVTGGYGHLGRSISYGLFDAGAIVIVLGKSITKFESAFPITKEIHFQQCDISSTTSIQSCYKRIIEKYNKIDVLINNAFYAKSGKADDTSDDDWEYTIDGVLNSVHRCIREALPYMRNNTNSKIINVASMYGMMAPDFNVYKNHPEYTNPPHYGAGKAGIIQLTKYYASLLGKENILVNCVSPGAFPSNKVQEKKEFVNQLSKKTVLNRIGQPEELQGVFVFLSSDASSYITGQNIVVDGGWTII